MVDIGGDNSRAPGRAARDRGQSETLGAVLVIAILISGATLVVAIGVMGISDTEDQLADSRAEKGMTQFSSKAGLVALEESDSQQVDFATDQNEQFRVDNTTGRMIISWENQTTGYNETVMDIDLGAFIYDGQDTELAYQGGGVFRASSGGGVMISPPEFHFRDGTLTLPAVNVTGDAGIGGRATVTRSNVVRKFPTGIDNSTNPLDDHVVTVTVQSEYYRGWGEYFEERTDGEVEYDPANETATLLMVTPIEITEITAASSSLSASGEFEVRGDTVGDQFTDSYNSSIGTYEAHDNTGGPDVGKEGDLIYSGDIIIDGGTGGDDFLGDITSGGGVNLSESSGGGQPDVYGNISYADYCSCNSSRIKDPGEPPAEKIDNVETASSVDWFVNNTIEQVEDDAVAAPGTPPSELNESSYYFDNLTVSSDDEVEINTTDNDVKIAVRENVVIEDNATLNVTGDGIVRMFVGGEELSGTEELRMYADSKIITPGDDATQFRMYGKANFDAELGVSKKKKSFAKYVGVLYAPPGQTGNGEIVLNGAEVFGGMLTGTTTIPNGAKGSIHYDEALLGKQVIPPNANQVKVTYLHVTVNQIAVKG